MARIALVCPFFEPSLGYQEWVLAKCLARQGHSVRVITSEHQALKPASRKMLEDCPGISVERLRTWGIRTTIFPRDAAALTRLCRDADLAVVNVPNHGFGYKAMHVLPPSLPVVLFFGDLLDNRRTMNPLIRRIKDRWYRWMFHRASRIACNTPEALSILEEIGGLGPHQGHVAVVGLPFDEDCFYYDPDTAREPGSPPVLITVTRPAPHKPFQRWLAAVFSFLAANPEWHYRFAGLAEDPTSDLIRKMIQEAGMEHRVELLPMQDHTALRKLYMTSDLAFFPRATIGIQQAMATGLPVVLPQRLTVAHLLREGQNGYYFPDLDHAASVLTAAARHPWRDRHTLSRENHQWAGSSFAARMVEGYVEGPVF